MITVPFDILPDITAIKADKAACLVYDKDFHFGVNLCGIAELGVKSTLFSRKIILPNNKVLHNSIRFPVFSGS